SNGDGVNAVQYQLGSWNTTTQTGVIQLDAQSLTTNIVPVYYLYYGQDTPTDGSSSLTIVTPEQCVIHRADPSTGRLPILDAVEESPAAVSPSQQVAATYGAQVILYWRIPRATYAP